MTVRPARLNAAIAWLFMVGSACFVLGSVPAHLDAVGSWVDGITVVGSLFFTTASYFQLVQAQSPATTDVDRPASTCRCARGCGAGCRTTQPARRGHPVPARSSSTSAPWPRSPTTRPPPRPTGTSGGRTSSGRCCSWCRARMPCSPSPTGSSASSHGPSWRIAWLNMLGSVLFMASALASYVLPSTDELVSTRVAVAGTLLGAVFLLGAALMFPAWRRALEPAPVAPRGQTPYPAPTRCPVPFPRSSA